VKLGYDFESVLAPDLQPDHLSDLVKILSQATLRSAESRRRETKDCRKKLTPTEPVGGLYGLQALAQYRYVALEQSVGVSTYPES
jgi:hypothetical protein